MVSPLHIHSKARETKGGAREKAESFDYFFLFESLVNWKERTTSGHLSSVFLKFMLGEMGFSEEMVSFSYFEAVSTAN